MKIYIVKHYYTYGDESAAITKNVCAFSTRADAEQYVQKWSKPFNDEWNALAGLLIIDEIELGSIQNEKDPLWYLEEQRQECHADLNEVYDRGMKGKIQYEYSIARFGLFSMEKHWNDEPDVYRVLKAQRSESCRCYEYELYENIKAKSMADAMEYFYNTYAKYAKESGYWDKMIENKKD